MRYELKASRVLLGLKQSDVAQQLGITAQNYAQKEKGERKFNDDEKVKLVQILNLSFDQFNRVFYKGKLPYASGTD